MLSCALHDLGVGFGFVMLMRVRRAKPAVTTGRAAPLPYLELPFCCESLLACYEYLHHAEGELARQRTMPARIHGDRRAKVWYDLAL